MKTTTRHALLGTLAAGLLALATAPVTVHAGQSRLVSSWIRAGLEVVGSIDGWLDEDEDETREFWLQRGVQYAFAGTCDNDCTDLDLKLFNRAGVLQVEDTDSDAYPRILFTPASSGTYRLRIEMYRCTIEPCRFDVDQYRR
jgi:hypothetical protein